MKSLLTVDYIAAKKKGVTLERDRIYAFRAKDQANNLLSHVRLVVGRIAEDETDRDVWNFEAYYFDMSLVGTGPPDQDGEPKIRLEDFFTGAQCELGSDYWVCKTDGEYDPKFKYAGKVAISHFEQVLAVVGEQGNVPLLLLKLI